jgi:predicted dehydrogenase
MSRVKIALIGSGMIAQIEHIPNLLRLKDSFDLVGVSDPSRASRGFVTEVLGVPAFEQVDELYAQALDAVLISSPDPLHYEQVLQALNRGLHVFCEKPLCYSPAEIDDIIEAREAAQKVVQVGYMKRFDPAYEAAIRTMPGDAGTLRYISVEVHDPDAWPFVRHHRFRRENDVAPALIEDVRRKQRDQVAKAIPVPLDEAAFRGFCTAYCSGLVHDVNAVHGLLGVLGVAGGEITGADLFARGDGGQGTVRLLGGQALWNMVHLTVPALADYGEAITLYFDDAILQLVFPSPYLNHQPTRLVIKKSDGHVLHTTKVNAGYEEAYIRELEGFWDAIVNGVPVRSSPEDARRDQALLCGLARWHALHKR